MPSLGVTPRIFWIGFIPTFHMLINQHALPFSGDTNPAYLKHTGSITLTCNMAKVEKDV